MRGEESFNKKEKSNIRKLRFIFDVKSGATPSSSNENYWDGNIYWITPEDLGKLKGHEVFSTKRKITEDGYKNSGVELAPSGSLVLSKRAPIGQLAILRVDATCNQGCFLLTKKYRIDERFYYYTLLHFRPHLEILGRGSTFMELSSDDLKSVKLPYPTFHTQQKIADYLDLETARIDALIEAKEKILSLLEEKRQALISRAVTKGLDPDVEMKDSGIEWLGEIPAHWEVIQLKYLITKLIQGTSPVASNVPAVENEYGVLKISSISKGNFLPFENKALYDLPDNLHLYTIAKDDVLMTRGNTPKLVGDACHVDLNYPNLIIPDLIYRIRTEKSKLHSKFLTYFIISNSGRMQIDQSAKGSNESMIKLSQNEILNWLIAVPSLVEQNEIVNYIDTFTEKSLQLSKEIEKSIALLKERRAALISAAVTGEIELGEKI